MRCRSWCKWSPCWVGRRIWSWMCWSLGRRRAGHVFTVHSSNNVFTVSADIDDNVLTFFRVVAIAIVVMSFAAFAALASFDLLFHTALASLVLFHLHHGARAFGRLGSLAFIIGVASTITIVISLRPGSMCFRTLG